MRMAERCIRSTALFLFLSLFRPSLSRRLRWAGTAFTASSAATLHPQTDRPSVGWRRAREYLSQAGLAPHVRRYVIYALLGSGSINLPILTADALVRRRIMLGGLFPRRTHQPKSLLDRQPPGASPASLRWQYSSAATLIKPKQAHCYYTLSKVSINQSSTGAQTWRSVSRQPTSYSSSSEVSKSSSFFMTCC